MQNIIGLLFIVGLIVAYWTFTLSDSFSYFVVLILPVIGSTVLLYGYLHNKILTRHDRQNDDNHNYKIKIDEE